MARRRKKKPVVVKPSPTPALAPPPAPPPSRWQKSFVGSSLRLWKFITGISVAVSIIAAYFTFKPRILVVTPSTTKTSDRFYAAYAVANAGYVPAYDVSAEFSAFVQQEKPEVCKGGPQLMALSPSIVPYHADELRVGQQHAFGVWFQHFVDSETGVGTPLRHGELCVELTYLTWWVPWRQKQRLHYITLRSNSDELTWFQTPPPDEPCRSYITRRMFDVERKHPTTC